MEKIVLTGTTHNMVVWQFWLLFCYLLFMTLQALRQLGQQLASNLNINFFDEPNVSPHRILYLFFFGSLQSLTF